MEIAEQKLIDGWVDRTARLVMSGNEDIVDFEDVRQTGWVSALSAYESFDPEAGSSLQSWILNQIKRDMYRYIEQERIEVTHHEDVDNFVEQEAEEFTDFEEEERVQNLSDLAKLLESCSEREAKILDLLYMQGLPEREVAEIEGVSRAMIRKIHDRALEKMREVGVPKS